MRLLVLLGFAAVAVLTLSSTAVAHDHWHYHHVRAEVRREIRDAMREEIGRAHV